MAFGIWCLCLGTHCCYLDRNFRGIVSTPDLHLNGTSAVMYRCGLDVCEGHHVSFFNTAVAAAPHRGDGGGLHHTHTVAECYFDRDTTC